MWKGLGYQTQMILDSQGVDPTVCVPIFSVLVKMGYVLKSDISLPCITMIEHRPEHSLIRFRPLAPVRKLRVSLGHEGGEGDNHKTDYVLDNREQRADAFGACLLIPEEGLKRMFKKQDLLFNVEFLADHYRVSVQFVLIRLCLFLAEPLAVVTRGRVLRYGDWGTQFDEKLIRRCAQPALIQNPRHHVLIDHNGTITSVWHPDASL